MKREIKFRAWDTEEKIMLIVDVLLFLADGSHKVLMSKKDFLWHPIVMQFTGLKDKNGKEIYEGDILVATLNVKTGESTSTYRRRRSTFAIYSDVEALGSVEMSDAGIWIWRSDKSITYNTGFWRGIGRTTLEKRANESVPTTYNLTRPLHEVLTKGGEIIGNIFENADILIPVQK